jgi:hypothetical protein
VTNDLERTVVAPAAADARDDASHRWFFVGMAVMLLGVVTLAVLYFAQASSINDTKSELATVSGIAQQAISTGHTLSDQVTKLGGTPAVQPPPADSVPGAPGTPGAAGATGATGGLGPQGPKGDTGAAGATPSTDFLLSLIRPLIPAPVPGPPGVTGTQGDPGQSVTGPAGPAGPAGANGADGAPGAAGADGARGPTGPPVYSWTYADALGGQHTCTRDVGSPDAQATYTCS